MVVSKQVSHLFAITTENSIKSLELWASNLWEISKNIKKEKENCIIIFIKTDINPLIFI